MVINLYTWKGDPRSFSRDLTLLGSADCQIYGNCSQVMPSFTLAYNAGTNTATYVEVPEWGLYYFIKDKRVDNGGRMIFNCDADALYSYRDQILGCEGVAVRNEGIGRPTMVIDSMLPIEAGRDVVNTYNLGAAFDMTPLSDPVNTRCFVVVTI